MEKIQTDQGVAYLIGNDDIWHIYVTEKRCGKTRLGSICQTKGGYDPFYQAPPPVCTLGGPTLPEQPTLKDAVEVILACHARDIEKGILFDYLAEGTPTSP